MSQKMTKNKWTTKNVITLAVFTFIIVVLINIDSMLLNLLITPLGAYFVVAGVSAVICGPFYMVMVNNIAKRGVFFFTCLLSGLIFLLTGYFVSTVTFIIAGVIGEICMLGQDAYHSFIRNMIGYYIYMLAILAGCFCRCCCFVSNIWSGILNMRMQKQWMSCYVSLVLQQDRLHHFVL